jgi:hypothetical protein
MRPPRIRHRRGRVAPAGDQTNEQVPRPDEPPAAVGFCCCAGAAILLATIGLIFAALGK